MSLIGDRYEPLGRVGAGAHGEVVKARDTRHDRIVALKIRPLTGRRLHDAARVYLTIQAPGVLGNDRDPECGCSPPRARLTYQNFSSSQQAFALFGQDGATFNGGFRITANAGNTGPFVFRYVSIDAGGLESGTEATVTISLT